MSEDRSDQELAQRLRAYESRIPDAEAPPTGVSVSPRSSWPVAVGTVIAAIAAGGLVAFGLLNIPPTNVGDANPSPYPTDIPPAPSPLVTAVASESPLPTTTMAATPSPSASGGSEASIRDAIWRVVVSDLVVRSAPGVADPGTILPARLIVEDRVLVVDGPRTVDGYEWYQVLPIRPDGLRERPFGWVAAGSRDGEPWLVMEELSCPNSSDLDGILGLAPEERLACFGGGTIHFAAGQEGACGAGGGFPVAYEPAWLAGNTSGCGFGGDAPDDNWLMLRFPPGTSQQFEPGWEVSGHFDDPAATTCTGTANDPEVTAPTQAEAVARCRTEFVVESVTPVP